MREELDDTADRLGGVGRVERRKDEVSGLGRLDRRLRRLGVAHLADQDHVRVLAQRAPERLAERGGVESDLALVDDALTVVMQELDRILDRDDVAAARGVDVADHRRERRRLARPGSAGAEDEAARLLGEQLDSLREVEVGEVRHATGDHAEGEGDGAALAERVDAQARQPGSGMGDVELAGLLEEREPRGVPAADDRQELLEVRLLERRPARHRKERTVVAHDRRLPDLEVDVAGTGVDRVPEQRVEIHPTLIGSPQSLL